MRCLASSLLLLGPGWLAATLAAQHPVAPAPDDASRIPGTAMHRCGTPTGPGAGIGIDHPDCSYTQTNPLAVYAPTALLRIPVVVHVIRNTSGQGNLSAALVQSQITVLNEDFRARSGTAGASGVDTMIEFFLATRDPVGAPTSGIVHHTDNSWFNDNGAYYNAVAWDTQRYLNIYTNNTGNGTLLGYVPALPQASSVLNTPADRVVIHYASFGRPALGGAPYGLGRTTTHEVGHYLGLFHTFDFGCDAGSCYSSGDRICDTAPEANARFGCPVGASSCGTPDPVRNYMDYTDDACMTGFTAEQARRMRCTLQHYRPGLAQPAGPMASATVRTGTGNLNSAYSCGTPRLGTQITASVLLFGSQFSLAAVYGFGRPAAMPLGTGTVLVDTSSMLLLELPLQVTSFVAQWQFTIPNDPNLAGQPIVTQGLLFGANGLGFTNAVDLVVGN